MKTDDTRMKHAPFWTVFFSLLSLVWIFQSFWSSSIHSNKKRIFREIHF